MWKPLLRCAIVGGVIVFLWYMIAWTVLPFHKMTMKQFVNESEVTATITREAPEDGVYVIPHMDEDNASSKGEPFIFVNVDRKVNFQDMTQSIVVGLMTQIIGAFLITYLLLKAKAMKYWKRVGFVVIAGIALAILGNMPLWTWWHYPCSWVVLGMIDTIIAWFLGGMVIAKLVKK